MIFATTTPPSPTPRQLISSSANKHSRDITPVICSNEALHHCIPILAFDANSTRLRNEYNNEQANDRDQACAKQYIEKLPTTTLRYYRQYYERIRRNNTERNILLGKKISTRIRSSSTSGATIPHAIFSLKTNTTRIRRGSSDLYSVIVI